jgi:hypothetical protein
MSDKKTYVITVKEVDATTEAGKYPNSRELYSQTLADINLPQLVIFINSTPVAKSPETAHG